MAGASAFASQPARKALAGRKAGQDFVKAPLGEYGEEDDEDWRAGGDNVPQPAIFEHMAEL